MHTHTGSVLILIHSHTPPPEACTTTTTTTTTTAQVCKRSQVLLRPPEPLTVAGLLAALRSLGRDTGQGATGRRQRCVAGLMRSTRSDLELKYLVRLLIQVAGALRRVASSITML
jgi:hypothetical protein